MRVYGGAFECMKTFTYHYIREDRNLIHTLGSFIRSLKYELRRSL
ncbi:hypothetical protein QES_3423 [Clostridioides difficile CD149]|nr:hypothetical protein QES_3423 [Clostridioides difficile CD149]EQH66966.1 hypothetical protein QMO_3198 [Clostridioides difficile DA00305]